MNAQNPRSPGADETAADIPELDGRLIPMVVRPGAILGAVGYLPAGRAFVLVTPHAPDVLLEKITAQEGEAVDVRYLQQGPDAWKVLISRHA